MDAILLGFVVLVTALVGYYVASKQKSHQSSPPGPPSYPLIGTPAAFKLAEPHRVHYNLAKKYGPIHKVDFGGFSMTMLNNPEIIKEAFSREEFVGRPRFWAITERSRVNGGGPGADGIVFAEGEAWKEHRRFVMQSFRDFGVGKFKMEEKLLEEAIALTKTLQDQCGRPVDTKLPLSNAVANVIASILTGARYDVEDPEFKKFVELAQENFTTNWRKLLLTIMPLLRHFPLQSTYAKFLATLRGLQGFFRKPIESHLRNWVPDRNSDFLEHYISAVKSGSYKTFSISHIPLLLEDLFEAGSETTTTTLRWAFLLMGFYPQVQARIHQELDENVAGGEIPTPSAKHRLPYTEATIMEIQRFVSVTPFGVPHRAVEDTSLGSYEIAKDAWVSANMYYCHHNEEWWDNPQSFDPTRFLTKDMELKQSDYLIPFSLGKRRCPGEGLARMELFIIFAAIVQRFTIQLPVAAQDVDLRPVPGGTDTKPHKLCFVPRASVDGDSSFLGQTPI